MRSILVLIVTLATAFCVFTMPALGQETVTITLISGNGNIGELDPLNLFSVDGGVTYEPAYIIVPHPFYSVIAGTHYINRNPTYAGPNNTSTLYKTTFELPADFRDASVTVNIHADNVATIYLNGTPIGQQTFAEIFPNFQDPPELFTTNDPSLFNAGTNTLLFDIYNFGGPTAFDYLAEMSYSLIPVLTVPIDIKPGSLPNSINLGSNGSVPVAILSTPDFDATTVDPATVTLASAAVRLRGKGTAMASFEDVDGDGLHDLVIHISTEALELNDSDMYATLEGQTFDGTRIRGMDTVRIVP